MRYHRSAGLTIIDQEDDDETNEHGSTSRDLVDYESYGSDNESAMPADSSLMMLKKLSKKSKKA